VEALADALGASVAERAALRAAASAASRLRPIVSVPKQPAVGAARLPVWLTSFVGREAEVEAVRAVLDPAESAVRLLTLLGPGGVGKTRLAVAAAEALVSAYPDGVVFVDLAPLREARLVPAAIARALEVQEGGGRNAQVLVIEHLRERQMLLLLDNFEHVPTAAPMVIELLQSCLRVAVLVTSRTVLRVQGERRFVVPPLATPTSGVETAVPSGRVAPSVQLYVERSQAVAGEFALSGRNAAAVASICRRLDGLPLAIELAAARACLLAPDQIAARLEDSLRLLTGGSGPARQQTLRATLDWSLGLLNPTQQSLFRRLAVFAGGCDLDAVEAVCTDADPGPWTPDSAGATGTPPASSAVRAQDVLDLLTHLVDASLVVAGAGASGAVQYRLLEPVRQYAAEHLEASGEEATVRARQATYFLGRAGQARTQRRMPDALLSLLAPDLDNLRTALHWLEQQPDGARYVALGGDMWARWTGRGLAVAVGATTGEAAPDGCTSAPPGPEAAEQDAARHELTLANGPSRQRAALGWWTSLFAYTAGDYEAARALGEESLAAWRELDDAEGIAQALSHLGIYVRELGDYDRAQALLEEGLACYRALGAPPETAHTLIRLGEVFQARGERDRAGTCYEEARALIEARGERSVRLPHHLGSVALDEERYAEAGAWFRESLALQRTMGLREWLHSSLADLACLAAAEGDAARAMRLAGAAERAAEEVGAKLQPTERRQLDGRLAVARQVLGKDATAAWAAGRALAVDDAVAEALAEPLTSTVHRDASSSTNATHTGSPSPTPG
jgi:predicted ATPase